MVSSISRLMGDNIRRNMVTIDARGLSCPEPVVLTMNEAKKGTKEFEVLVDAEVCKDNVKRYAENNGYNVKLTKEGIEYTLSLSKK